jgi:hypothetical protein
LAESQSYPRDSPETFWRLPHGPENESARRDEQQGSRMEAAFSRPFAPAGAGSKDGKVAAIDRKTLIRP